MVVSIVTITGMINIALTLFIINIYVHGHLYYHRYHYLFNSKLKLDIHPVVQGYFTDLGAIVIVTMPMKKTCRIEINESHDSQRSKAQQNYVYIQQYCIHLTLSYI